MSKKNICKDCRGTKKIKGLGYIVKDCVSCAGTGIERLEEVSEPTKPPIEQSVVTVQAAKKGRGRPRLQTAV